VRGRGKRGKGERESCRVFKELLGTGRNSWELWEMKIPPGFGSLGGIFWFKANGWCHLLA